MIAALLVVTAVMCVGYFGFEDENAAQIVSAVALLVVLTFKVLVLRVWTGLGRLLPGLGVTVFVLLALTWATSAGSFLAGD